MLDIKLREQLYQLEHNWYSLYELLESYKGKFPYLLPPVTYNSNDRWPFWAMANKEYLGLQEIELDSILGDNWANTKDRGDYPKISKLATILAGMLWRKRYFGSTDIPPIDVYKINNEHYTNEGNHRIYAGRLLDKKTISANVFEVKYNELIGKARIIKKFGTSYFAIIDDNNYYDFYTIRKVEEERLRELGVQVEL